MSGKIKTWLGYLRRLPGGGENVLLLAALAIVVALIWGFIELADEVLEGDTQALDAKIVRSMRRADDPSIPIGPYWVQEIGRDATALGGAGWLTFFTAVVAGYLWLDRKYRMTGFLLAATVGGLLISGALKLLFSRPRPDVVPHLSHVATSSFPSGHSLLSAVVYVCQPVRPQSDQDNNQAAGPGNPPHHGSRRQCQPDHHRRYLHIPRR